MSMEFAQLNFQTFQQQYNDCVRIIKSTSNPLTFFYRYDFLIKRAIDLGVMCKLLNINTNDPFKYANDSITEKQKYITELINRCEVKTRQKIEKLANNYSIELEISSFENAFDEYVDEMNTVNIQLIKKYAEKLNNDFINAPVEPQISITVRTYDVTEKWQSSENDDFSLREKEFSKCYSSENGLKPNEILVLYYAQTFRTDRKDFQSFWKWSYGITDVKKVLNKLEELNLICQSSATESIEMLTIPELKELLKIQNKKTSGKKSELIDRLFQDVDETFLEENVKKRYYKLTEKGIEELKNNQYVSYFHSECCFKVYGMDITWANKALHDNPERKLSDLMLEEIFKHTKSAIKAAKEGRYRELVTNYRLLGVFWLKEEDYLKATEYLLKSAYYNANIEAVEHLHNTDAYYDNENREYKLTFLDFIYIEWERFTQIKRKLNLSTEQFKEFLLDRLSDLADFDNPIPNEYLSDLIVYKVDNDSEMVKVTCDKIEAIIK